MAQYKVEFLPQNLVTRALSLPPASKSKPTTLGHAEQYGER